jgi:hypothetical protein
MITDMHHPNEDHQPINRRFMLARHLFRERSFRFRFLPAFAPPPRMPDLRRLPFNLSATQRGQKRQGPDAAAPRQPDQQHHREPFQAETFDGVFVTGSDRVTITPQAIDLLAAPPLDRVIRANDERDFRRQQARQQAKQNPACLQSTPTRAIEHSMIILKSLLFAQANDSQTSRDRALAARQQSTQQQKFRVLPNRLGKQRLENYYQTQQFGGQRMHWEILSCRSFLPQATLPAATISKFQRPKLDKALMNLGTPPAMKIRNDRSMITLSSVTEGRSRLGALNPG